ncbi:putative serine/threonine-protein kinase Nek1, putative,protein kinase [Trypanosoma grayi]|uniref:putative serine/threonine-protein kinase Nek1, putative,protein kinase n=1 Tax=Trypanosoma grayi TaxID=71804 RepID=UPI0004F44920|nr:putative serine/threonine-protein kinase Nek1, putative,protein kinase [Trypanosoma grayi]KEG13754.1 putative serine/threonine-protein kinase Nek1, putative,protein kinase [Trypanosoma grayi]
MQLRDTSAPDLKRYIIGEYLGQGSTSDVFNVTDALTKKEYVLKQMSLESMGDAERLRVKKEILVMNDVDHPNIVKFRESFSGDNSVNIIMENCECTLEELIERQQDAGGQPFPEEAIIEWMAELLCGLAYLHSRRIVHRDIKTSNIFLTEKNHVKLGDFGVCTVLTSATVAAHSMIGTPLYFSPEVCEEEAYDERSDVWSLGVVFYEMCTLRRPFEAAHLPALIQQILTKDVAPFNTGLDTRFEEIVRRMLSKDPRDRPTAQDLIDKHLVVPPSHPSHPSQKPSRSRLIQQYYGPEIDLPPAPSGGQVAVGQQQQQQRQQQQQLLQKQDNEKNERKNVPPTKAVTPKAKAKKRDPIEKRRPGNKEVGKELNAEERIDAMKRIKNAKSKINMTELRENMLRRRSQLFGEMDASLRDGIPVVIELQPSLLSPGTLDIQRDGSSDCSATVRPKSSFLDDIAAVIRNHSSGGVTIDLEQLEDAASLLCQYKLTNHGLY